MRELNRPAADQVIAPNPMSEPMNIESPCVRLCCIDETTGLCVGCARSLDEITGWSGFDAADKLRVLAAVEARRAERKAP